MSDASSESPGGMPTRSEIENWQTSDLDGAATRWRQLAAESEEMFAQHRHNIAEPGATVWSGDAHDTAMDRATADAGVVRTQGDIQREAADIAEDGSRDIQAAKREVLNAIAETEAAGFRVGENLAVTDTRRVDLSTVAARHTAAREHAEDIRWFTQRLVQAEAYIGERLEAKAAELESIRFQGEEHIGPV